MSLLLRGCELDDGAPLADVLVGPEGHVTAVAPPGRLRPPRDAAVLDARGGALLPGLADRHLHLLATAAAAESVPCGDPATFAASLRARAAVTPPGGWVRGVGHHGDLDRWRLDEIVTDRPVRVQHRGGALWVVNSLGARLLGLDDPGADRPAGADPRTGRLFRADAWLRDRLGPAAVPDVAAVGRRLAAYGITAVTDATADLDRATVRLLTGAGLPQRIELLGDPDGTGPVKLVPPDHDLWPYEEFTTRIRAVRPRPVAVHCVTLESLVLTLTALAETGPVPGDRIEHAAVVPPDVLPLLRSTGVRVVTQPAFVAERGDAYLAEVEPADRPYLYPYASLLAAGVPVHPSSDAPYGTGDPWAVVRAARDRRTRGGRVVGGHERVPAAVALRGLLHRPRVGVGMPADLVLLHLPWAAAVAGPHTGLVRTTLLHGAVTAGETPG